MKIKIICVGKLKEKYLKDAISEYSKRLGRFCNFEVTELSDEKIPDNPSAAEEEKVLFSEGEKILKCIAPSDYVISLCVEGKQQSSEEFASMLSKLALGGKSTICFIIGGSLGLHNSVKTRSDLRLGFSKMTFPHQLMRVFLTEQIYRAFKINANEKYHK
ncbi:MAG: 23S rRNA (pseudouridine(1915)-N(3))-methyltransferase RlmH [Clostridia bacterium]|nr:23S rRNA (pseudouridine(1915)-N(3))-methyltransferase RlmH [Clostridia bacterium]